MRALWQDIRYGFRMLLKRPGITALTLLTLALGIGANSAIFSVVDAILLRPLPYPEPERLIYMEGMDTRDRTAGGAISPPDFLDFREHGRSFERMAAFQSTQFTLTSERTEAERLTTARVSAGFFETFGVKLLPGGRTFQPEEEQAGRNRVAVISHALWQRFFGGDPQALGKTVTLNGTNLTVVGVAPPEFQYPPKVDLWLPIAFRTPQTSIRRFHNLNIVGRLRPGATLAQAQAELSGVARQLEQQYPDTNTNFGISLTPLPERIIGETSRSLLVVSVAAGFVLLIVCANVANLALVRGTSRYRESAIRAALGASRGRIVRQLLTESVVQSFIGGLLGLLLAVWGVRLLVMFGPENLPRIGEVAINWRVLGFTLVVSLVTGVLFGIAPALSFSKTSLTDSLKEGSRGSTSSAGKGLRSLLVVSEVAVSLILLIGAGLLIKSFLRLSRVELGFRPEAVLTSQFSLLPTKYPDTNQRAVFFGQLLDNIKALPGVQAVGTVSELPLSGQENDTFFAIRGQEAPAFGSLENNADIRVVSSGYFQALGIPLKRGRMFPDRDSPDAPKAIIVDEDFVREFIPQGEALGTQLSIDFGEPMTGEIVGVVGNIRHTDLSSDPEPKMYVHLLQSPGFGGNLVIRTSSDPARLGPTLTAAVRALDRDLPIYNIKTMEQHISSSVSQARFRTMLLSIFAGLALLLASLGIYGVISYTVMQRTHELGLRMALGAQRGHIFRLVLVKALGLVLIGVGIGLFGALALTRMLSSVLFDISATDPLTFVGVPVLLVCIALLACYVPAHKATKIDPLEALRYE